MKSYLKTRALVAPTLLLAACGSGQKEAEEKPLNIIHIMTDDHSYQTISAYGHPISKLAPTPNLDRLASEGMLFRKAFVENSLSTPSRACLMTGLYSHQNGQRQLGKGIDSTKVFFSEILQQHGYQTGVVGKWHMQCEPKGFDYYHVLWDQGDYYNPEFKSKKSNGAYVKEEGYATTLTTDHAIEFLEERNPDKPFCLLVHHKAPHRNWMPEGKYLDLYEEIDFPLPETFYDDYNTRCEAARTQQMRIENDMTLVYDLKVDELKSGDIQPNDWLTKSWNASLDRMTPEQRDAWMAAYKPKNEAFIAQNLSGDELLKWKYQRYLKDYLRCIKTIDDEVGRLIAYLEEEGLMENTVIVYTSDQGFYMGEHGWFDKRFMYEESFRTPLIIRHPSKIKAGSVCDALVQNLDYAPTYLALAGIEKPAFMEGTSLVPLFSGQTPNDWREYLYYHYYDYPAIHQVRRHDGVRDNRYKLIHFYGEANQYNAAIDCNELYDLQSDPNEVNNLYGNPAYAEVVSRLQQRLDNFRQDLKVDEY
ncbi:arylsulfatase A-like enzyme [Parabacteroides sp. PF5-5]|uniref:sulfatase family protein n=1 Tax=unclassified Parabacteroides TaxID=2649774 RepID=UPI002474BABA|nr:MULTISPECIES: sulfatase [unclassified Parabacteroides]MDH6305346.1 arylsulfatase A-like enzyme [Parabacteroides sp. PH5-39]MDH6316699.1 arylsulfatase A-like enzyme [Parabacteroides sp. PF5-13]MDH6320121.1 arylsulfatase A-like enzyme [Parabacteroides sp. PH5-13]MDH6323936.1 arylsulfatase A-like enzyme [Parabacteroides sp. PH5-8]MDH6327798.1 arylsulfatase A-like enzyme [Parabacteroides sp. PH5-41]